MVNFNGSIIDLTHPQWDINQIEKLRFRIHQLVLLNNDSCLFLEEHYFHLMANLRILRANIPMNYTLEFFENEIKRLCEATNNKNGIIQLNFYGLQLLNDKVQFAIRFVSDTHLISKPDRISLEEVGLYKDYYYAEDLLSSINPTENQIYTLGKIFCKENQLDAVFFLNHNKTIINSTKGTVFSILGNKITHPSLDSGAPKTVLNEIFIKFLKQNTAFEVVEHNLNPFEFQRQENAFVLNEISGIQPVINFRKKIFSDNETNELQKGFLKYLIENSI